MEITQGTIAYATHAHLKGRVVQMRDWGCTRRCWPGLRCRLKDVTFVEVMQAHV